jgi:GxxExxY protein
MKELTEKIIGAAIEVHKTIGPGLLEWADEECLAPEMRLRGPNCERQVSLPVAYKGVTLDSGYGLDFLVKQSVVLELKAVEAIEPIRQAQLLTYPKVGGWTAGLLMNFNVPVLKNGIKRVPSNYEDVSASSAPLR